VLNAVCRSPFAALWLTALLAMTGCSLDRAPALERDSADAGPAGGTGGTGGGDSGLPPQACTDDNGGCSPLVECGVVAGRVQCGECPAGTTDVEEDGTQCIDIDECELGTHDCDINPRATCINVLSSYRCRCPEGTGDPTTEGRNCVVGGGGPVDECELGLDDCDPDPQAQCIDEANGFSCVCPAGYADASTNGTNCEDVDECELGTHDCDTDPVAQCENTEGGYTCTCPAGFEDLTSGGRDCTDINDCAGDNECDDEPGACVDGIGGYACVCPAGYSDTLGDGSQCDDINECTAGFDRCDDAPAAQCDNTIGAYTCSCPDGTTDPLGNGWVCTEPKTRVALGGRQRNSLVRDEVTRCSA